MTKRDELVERIKQRLKSLVPVDYGMRDEEAKSYARAAIAECEKDRSEDYEQLLGAYRRLESQCAVMRGALESYACDGLGKCKTERLKDGTCLIAATSGGCGNTAHNALSALGWEP